MDVKVLNFTIFLIHKLANFWKVSPSKVYGMLNSSGILDNYIIKCYDVLHSLGAEAMVDDISELAREKAILKWLSFTAPHQLSKKPDVSHSKRFLDFGRGFYVTTYKSQAEHWAKRKSIRNGNQPIVNPYEMRTEGFANFKLLNLNEDISAWLDFVFACRKSDLIYLDYDIITGPVADDDVFKLYRTTNTVL